MLHLLLCATAFARSPEGGDSPPVETDTRVRIGSQSFTAAELAEMEEGRLVGLVSRAYRADAPMRANYDAEVNAFTSAKQALLDDLAQRMDALIAGSPVADKSGNVVPYTSALDAVYKAAKARGLVGPGGVAPIPEVEARIAPPAPAASTRKRAPAIHRLPIILGLFEAADDIVTGREVCNALKAATVEGTQNLAPKGLYDKFARGEGAPLKHIADSIEGVPYEDDCVPANYGYQLSAVGLAAWKAMFQDRAAAAPADGSADAE